MKNFIVFCFARTGSYRLIDVLNHQDDVIAYGEIFKPNSFEVSQDILEQINYEKSNFLKRDKAPIHFYKKLARLHEDKKFGFKIFPNHNDRVLKYLAKHEDIIKIFLVRNPVQTYISEKVARASDQWVVKEGFKRRNSEVTVKFDVESFSQHLRYRIAWYSYIKSLSTLSGSKIHTIDYFDSLDDDYLNNFFNSIGIKTSTIETTHRKAILKSYEDIVENWSDLELYLDKYQVDENTRFVEFCGRFIKS